MTNSEIITNELKNLELDPLTTIVDTYPGWKRKGFIVKHGEHALFKTKIWKPCSVKAKDGGQNQGENIEENMILVSASFFLDSQVKKL